MDRPADRPAERRTPVYTLARWLTRLISLLLFPIRYHGADTINAMEAPYMLVSNHASMLDPLMLAVPVRRYELRFLGKPELGANRLFRWVLDRLHMISVSRHMTDMAAMRASNEVLAQGHVLALFPEGTRKPPEQLMEGVESGVSLLALRNKVPLMPAYIHGRIRLFRTTHIYFLPQLHYEDLAAQGIGKDAVDALTQRLVATIRAARDEAAKNLSDNSAGKQGPPSNGI